MTVTGTQRPPSTVLPVLPTERGPLSEWILKHVRGGQADRPAVGDDLDGRDDDGQLALYLCYELSYSGLAGVADEMEWDPDVIGFRSELEHAFERVLRADICARTTTTNASGHAEGRPAVEPVGADDVSARLCAAIAADDGPSISSFLEADGSLDHMREFVRQRSAYQRKEADPHTFGLPRLQGRAKQLLARIQAGEYGTEAPEHRMHSELFADTMTALGLDPAVNAYLDDLPGSALAVSNLVSMFGLHRRWRGALAGHLAVFEMTSVTAMGRYRRGLERMGAPARAMRFYDVHIKADAEHEVVALELVREVVAAEPQLGADVLFGASCVFAVERRFAEHLLCRFSAPQGPLVPELAA